MMIPLESSCLGSSQPIPSQEAREMQVSAERPPAPSPRLEGHGGGVPPGVREHFMWRSADLGSRRPWASEHPTARRSPAGGAPARARSREDTSVWGHLAGLGARVYPV